MFFLFGAITSTCSLLNISSASNQSFRARNESRNLHFVEFPSGCHRLRLRHQGCIPYSTELTRFTTGEESKGVLHFVKDDNYFWRRARRTMPPRLSARNADVSTRSSVDMTIGNVAPGFPRPLDDCRFDCQHRIHSTEHRRRREGHRAMKLDKAGNNLYHTKMTRRMRD
jgi:hypothetical protein